jgi:glycosyltransferase involved in cell wall biosynthesis
MYGINDVEIIDLPVRAWEYQKEVEKLPKSCIFTSIPDRGVMQLHAAWAEIVAKVPDAKLTITSDWRLWTDAASEDMITKYKLKFSKLPNITYLGAVNRSRLVEIQQSAQLHLYPCVYEELFCISVAESQVAGTLPITSSVGAVQTTNMGIVINGSPFSPEWSRQFVETSVEYLKDDALRNRVTEEVKEKAVRRYSPDTILEQWEKLFNE